MDQYVMEQFIIGVADEAEGGEGFVQFEYDGTSMYLLSDTHHNRMRIIAPIVEYDELTEEHIEAIMVSNFHLALDARYAVSDNVLYAAYIHPLAELTEGQLKAALRQVANLVLTFGTEYSSGELSFYGTRSSDQAKH